MKLPPSHAGPAEAEIALWQCVNRRIEIAAKETIKISLNPESGVYVQLHSMPDPSPQIYLANQSQLC